MKIASVAGALPPHRFHQSVITEALRIHWGERLERPELLARLHSRAGVEYRNFALTFEGYKALSNWGECNAAWFAAAEELGVTAISRALERAALTPTDLDALFVVSSTGVATPSLDARLINRMGLRRDLKRTPIFGLGCVGGAAGLTRAADYVKAYPAHRAALLAVEICSLTIQHHDLSTANLIATGLFGDGGAAVIVAGAELPAAGPEILGSQATFYPQSEDIMGWDISEQGFQIMLSAKLPELIRQCLATDLERFLARYGVVRADIGSWIFHTGGPKILEAVAEVLSLGDRELDLSWESLRRHGNISSGAVLLVLEETLMAHRPAPGTLGVLAAMGPGFCSEMVLLRW